MYKNYQVTKVAERGFRFGNPPGWLPVIWQARSLAYTSRTYSHGIMTVVYQNQLFERVVTTSVRERRATAAGDDTAGLHARAS